jgi:hypothetical protein
MMQPGEIWVLDSSAMHWTYQCRCCVFAHALDQRLHAERTAGRTSLHRERALAQAQADLAKRLGRSQLPAAAANE